MASRDRSTSSPRSKAGTLLVSVGILGASMALPATLAAAQGEAPATAPDVAQGPTATDPAPAPAPSPAPGTPDGAQPVGTGPTQGVAPPGNDSGVAGAGTSPVPAAPGATATPAPAAPPSALASVTASGSDSASIVGSNPNSYAFSPASISVKAGDTVTWHNSSSAAEGHTVTGDGFDSGILHQGKSYSHTFASAGTFRYVCSIHPYMKGTITVQASTASSSSNSNSSGGGDNSTSGSDGTTPATGNSGTASGSESAAGTSPGAAGSSTQLPSTGLPVLPLLVAGLGLAALGALMRRRAGV